MGAIVQVGKSSFFFPCAKACQRTQRHPRTHRVMGLWGELKQSRLRISHQKYYYFWMEKSADTTAEAVRIL